MGLPRPPPVEGGRDGATWRLTFTPQVPSAPTEQVELVSRDGATVTTTAFPDNLPPPYSVVDSELMSSIYQSGRS